MSIDAGELAGKAGAFHSLNDGRTTVAAWFRWPSSSWSWCLEALRLSTHEARWAFSAISLSYGRDSVIVAELISMPRNVNAITGPSTFSGATGSPKRLHRGIAMLTSLAQLVELAGPQKKKSSR